MIDPQSLRRAFDRSILPIAAGGAVTSLIALGLVLVRPPWWPAPFAVVLALPLLIVVVAGRVPRRGALSDRRLLGVLEELEDEGYRSWHDVECGPDVVSHVLLGATGAFVVEASSVSPDRRGEDGLAWS